MKSVFWYIVLLIGMLVVSALLVEAVWNSDLPMWLKWFLIR